MNARCLTEFLGTFILVFSVGCNVLAGNEAWGVVATAFTLMAGIYAFAGVSGAHFNPVVSLALSLYGEMPWLRCLMYICVQLVAGIMAALSYGSLYDRTFPLGGSGNWWQKGMAEMLYTGMLVFVILRTAVGKNQFYAMAIAFVVIAGGYGAGPISGACFNPAVAFAISVTSELSFDVLTYWLFEVVGCCLAVCFYHVCDNRIFGRLLSEFLGTYFLVLTVGLNVLAGSPAAAFSIAAALTAMIFALGQVSGAHFNPAVTLAVLCAWPRKHGFLESFAYILVQCTAGLCAAWSYAVMHGGRIVPLEPSVSETRAMLAEFIFTCLLATVVLSVATRSEPRFDPAKEEGCSGYFGLAIGACVVAGGVAIGGLTGGSLNPAVSLALSGSEFFVAEAWAPVHLLSYVVAECLGGVLAAIIFSIAFAHEAAQ